MLENYAEIHMGMLDIFQCLQNNNQNLKIWRNPCSFNSC